MASFLDYLNFGSGGPELLDNSLLGMIPGGRAAYETGKQISPLLGPAATTIAQDYNNRYAPATFDERFGFPAQPQAPAFPQQVNAGPAPVDAFGSIPMNRAPVNLPNPPTDLAPPNPAAPPPAVFTPPPQQQGGGGFGDRLSMALQGLVNPQTPFTYNALRQSGVPHPQALLQATSLETAQANMPTWGIIAQDDFGNNKYGWINRATGQIAVPGAGPGGPGITEAVDREGNPLMGQDYLTHLEKNSPTMGSLVKCVLAGSCTASGRKLQMAIAAASRVEDGFDMNVYNARKTLVTDSKKATPNSFGGQRNAGNTAIEHLGDASTYAKELGNYDVGIPGLSHLVNWARQQGNTDNAAAANKLNDAVDRYVAEVAKFYAGSNTGGVAERDAARDRFASVKTGKELAAAIEAERDLFTGKLKQLQAHRDETFPDQVQADKLVGPVIRKESTEALDKINNNISTLKGNAPSTVQEITATNPKTGEKAVYRNGKWQKL